MVVHPSGVPIGGADTIARILKRWRRRPSIRETRTRRTTAITAATGTAGRGRGHDALADNSDFDTGGDFGDGGGFDGGGFDGGGDF